MYKKRIFSSVAFFITGIFLFWLVYHDFDIGELKNALREIKYEWIFLSIGIGLLSHFLRALRWKMLIRTMNYKPWTANLFLSIMVLYFTNLIIPRGGEVSRCAVISRYERIPFVKLAGTVFIERIIDFFAFMIIFLVLLLWQFGFFRTVFNYPEFKLDFTSLQNLIIPALISLALLTIIILLMLRYRLFRRIILKLKKIRGEFIEGIAVILHMKGKLKFIFYTFMIFLLWLLMLYAAFFSYPPTENLSFKVAVLTYTFGTLAYLLPIQAGIGAWHFIVISCLFFYGIDRESGMIFALIAHTFTNMIFLVFGPVALALLPVINGKIPDNQNDKNKLTTE